MKAEEIKQIKKVCQGMTLNEVVDCINYLEAEHDFGKYLIDSLPGSLVREYRRDFERQKKKKNET